ncbi:MAG TPA: hypothetical protein VK034_29295 [Enhygromyxa sp.]|nr:hypothetical protein [Enhygromyxa sp.]
MRHPSIAAFALLLTAACADAPITAADIQADGQLRQTASPSQQSVHAASEREPKLQTAEHLRVTGLLAAQADGPLEDATRFSLESEAIYLHLRVDDLNEPRPVTFVWTRGEHRRETMGFLQPAETISLAASLPLAQYADTESVLELVGEWAVANQWTAIGEWKLEVYSTDSHRSLLFERDFEVIEPEIYEAMQLADASAAEDF